MSFPVKSSHIFILTHFYLIEVIIREYCALNAMIYDGAIISIALCIEFDFTTFLLL